jgi:hypothetical protein
MNDLSELTTPISVSDIAEPIEDELARDVRDDFVQAENYRRIAGVEERLLRALRARRLIYDPEDQALLNGITIYIGLIGLKCRSASAWINDILLNSIDKPWTLSPTKIPELPDWMREQVVDALEMELQQMGASMDIRKRAKELKDAAYKYAVQKAQIATASMESKIEDQFQEGDWRKIFAEFVDDLTTFPVAVIRDPIVKKERRLTWDGNKVVEKEQVIYSSRRISPFDFYPSMNSTTTQDGTYVIERFRAQPEQLYNCIGLDGFNDDAVRSILNEYGETGFSEMLKPDYQRMYLEDKYQAASDFNLIDILIRNGKTLGSKLLKYNILVPDPQKYYETEIWTVNNRTIKAVLNPYPLETRPLFSTSFVKVPGSLWGEGMCDILRDVGKMVNSAARSIVRNMSFSSGPIGEVDVSRLGDGERPEEIFPYKLYHVDSDLTGGSQPAFKFQVIPSVVPELGEIFDKFSKLADDLSGVPSYVLGNPQVAGAGRTLGGLSMLMGNAAKGIKNVILNVDRDVMEPLVTLRYNINMKYDDDPDIKSDAQVVARGATGLLQRELSQTRLVELMQTYIPLFDKGLIPPQGMQILIRESMKNSGLPVDDIIPNPDRVAQLQEGLGRLGVGTALQTGTNTPAQLDGRSAPPPFPQQSIPPPLMSPGAGNTTNPYPMPTNLPQGS